MPAIDSRRVRRDTPTCRVVDRGPDWLFVRVESGGASGPADGRANQPVSDCLDGLAESLWEVAEQHFVYRIVLEIGLGTVLDGPTKTRLERLRERLAEHGGMLRVATAGSRTSRPEAVLPGEALQAR